MKFVLMVIMFGLVGNAAANPYFRFSDPIHPQMSAGVFIDPAEPGHTSVGKSIALITHSPKDGCLIQSLCENWTILGTGLAINSGKLLWTIGPSANLSPILKAFALTVIENTTGADDWFPLKALLSPDPESSWAVAFGPAIAFHPVDHGTIIPLKEWKGRPVIFAGSQWKW